MTNMIFMSFPSGTPLRDSRLGSKLDALRQRRVAAPFPDPDLPEERPDRPQHSRDVLQPEGLGPAVPARLQFHGLLHVAMAGPDEADQDCGHVGEIVRTQ